ncbi:MAG: bifunctional nuclease family protein [Armatimonadetes bacterium]|nr:bifunctional nuclease family protein [Armatimonadota bacterium]
MPEEFEGESPEFEVPPSFFPYKEDEGAGTGRDYGEPVEVQVEGVFSAESNGDIQRFVLLTDGERKLTIVIGGFEATAIHLALEGTQPDRPMTHDLLKTIVDRLEGEMDRVVIDDIWSTTYYAKLFLKHQDKEMAIDCRPSDAIALALRFEVPILVSEGILELRG